MVVIGALAAEAEERDGVAHRQEREEGLEAGRRPLPVQRDVHQLSHRVVDCVGLPCQRKDRGLRNPARMPLGVHVAKPPVLHVDDPVVEHHPADRAVALVVHAAVHLRVAEAVHVVAVEGPEVPRIGHRATEEDIGPCSHLQRVVAVHRPRDPVDPNDGIVAVDESAVGLACQRLARANESAGAVVLLGQGVACHVSDPVLTRAQLAELELVGQLDQIADLGGWRDWLLPHCPELGLPQ
mmetsp:Transcript_59315/g.133607  ORF Transcript_59315/g.133607 Transcript_59315/m.133607 type:complete len:239 (+) Transcript_59315:282-998(+)